MCLRFSFLLFPPCSDLPTAQPPPPRNKQHRDTEEVESTVARLGCEDLISVRARRFMSYELRQCWGDWSVIGVDPLSLFLLGGHVLHFFKSETGGLEWAQDEGLHVLEEEAVVRSGEFFDLQDESLVQGFGRGEGVSGRLGHVELLLAYPARLLLMAASSSASADLVLHERTILDAVRCVLPLFSCSLFSWCVCCCSLLVRRKKAHTGWRTRWRNLCWPMASTLCFRGRSGSGSFRGARRGRRWQSGQTTMGRRPSLTPPPKHPTMVTFTSMQCCIRSQGPLLCLCLLVLTLGRVKREKRK